MNHVRFLRVIGVRTTALKPSVVAVVDNAHVVKWNPKGWECACDVWTLGTEDGTCEHVEAVAALLDPRVVGDAG